MLFSQSPAIFPVNTAGFCGFWTPNIPSFGAGGSSLTQGGFGAEAAQNTPMVRWRARSFHLNLQPTSFGRNWAFQGDLNVPMTVKPAGISTDEDFWQNPNPLPPDNPITIWQ